MLYVYNMAKALTLSKYAAEKGITIQSLRRSPKHKNITFVKNVLVEHDGEMLDTGKKIKVIITK